MICGLTRWRKRTTSLRRWRRRKYRLKLGQCKSRLTKRTHNSPDVDLPKFAIEGILGNDMFRTRPTLLASSTGLGTPLWQRDIRRTHFKFPCIPYAFEVNHASDLAHETLDSKLVYNVWLFSTNIRFRCQTHCESSKLQCAKLYACATL